MLAVKLSNYYFDFLLSQVVNVQPADHIDCQTVRSLSAPFLCLQTVTFQLDRLTTKGH